MERLGIAALGLFSLLVSAVGGVLQETDSQGWSWAPMGQKDAVSLEKPVP